MKSREILQCATSPRAALEAGRQLIGQWPHAKPADPETYAAALAAVLAQYPLGLVEECVDPRRGLARERDFPPSVACLVDWCDKRLAFHQSVAGYQGRAAVANSPVEQDFSDDHCRDMLGRLSRLMHEIFDRKDEKWVRPIGVFETPTDKWNDRR